MSSKPDRGVAMPVKYWSFAGLMLTYRCDAACRFCYLACGPQRTGPEMSVEQALRIWEQLIAASPHGCRVHLSGGEPTGDWERLIEICRRAHRAGLGPLEKIETNASWACNDQMVLDRLRQLDQVGMQKLGISADPYHQEYVPIERPRRLVRLACELLGTARVQVRWRDWLEAGQDIDGMDQERRRELLIAYARRGRDRLNGRAAEMLADWLPLAPVGQLAGRNCREALLRSRHVHVDGAGLVTPGTCAGLILGRAGPDRSVADLWRQVNDDYARRPVLAALVSRGPAGLAELARKDGFEVRDGYAGRCHLCWSVRRHLARRGLYADELGPAELYHIEAATSNVPNHTICVWSGPGGAAGEWA
jgi:hypothetical protein